MSEILTGILTRDVVLNRGRYPHPVKAGTYVTLYADSVESGRSAVYVRLADRPRIGGTVYIGIVDPA